MTPVWLLSAFFSLGTKCNMIYLYIRYFTQRWYMKMGFIMALPLEKYELFCYWSTEFCCDLIFVLTNYNGKLSSSLWWRNASTFMIMVTLAVQPWTRSSSSPGARTRRPGPSPSTRSFSMFAPGWKTRWPATAALTNISRLRSGGWFVCMCALGSIEYVFWFLLVCSGCLFVTVCLYFFVCQCSYGVIPFSFRHF